jgi:carnitine O-acetyltransferase
VRTPILQLGYLAVRDPVVVNVSYFFSFTDDPTIDAAVAESNVQRAATLLFATAEFRKQVCTGQQPREQIGKKKIAICSTAYKYMFHACRIPHQGQDTYRIYDPSRYTHCIVSRKGFFFAMELVDPESGDPLPIMVLEDQLRQCLRLADAVSSTRPKLGLMTSQDRNDWADAREALLQVGGLAMEEALAVLESGAVLLNLDDEAPVSRQECGDLFWTGGLKSGGNRWFDKSIQIIVPNNGKAGAIMEHSMMDGMPIIVFADYITKMTYAEAKRRSLNRTIKTNGKVTDIFGNVLNSIDPSIPRKLETKGVYLPLYNCYI